MEKYFVKKKINFSESMYQHTHNRGHELSPEPHLFSPDLSNTSNGLRALRIESLDIKSIEIRIF